MGIEIGVVYRQVTRHMIHGLCVVDAVVVVPNEIIKAC